MWNIEKIADIIKINNRIGNLCNAYPKLQDFLLECQKEADFQEAGWNFIKTLTRDDKLDIHRQNPFLMGQKMYDKLDAKATNFLYEKMNEIIKEFESMPKWAKEKLEAVVAVVEE